MKNPPIFVCEKADEAGLTQAEFRIYGHIARRHGDDKPEGAWPGVDSMAEICQMSKTTVIDAIRELELRKMIRVVRKLGKSTHYWLNPLSEWSNVPVHLKERTCSPKGTVPVHLRERKEIHRNKYNERNTTKENGQISYDILDKEKVF